MNKSFIHKIETGTTHVENQVRLSKRKARQLMRSWKLKVFSIIVGAVLCAGVVFMAFYNVSQWYDQNQVIFKFPVEIRLYQPVRIEKRKLASPIGTDIKKEQKTQEGASSVEILYPPSVSQTVPPTDNQIADYIRSKDWDYSVAIRLAKSENYWNLTRSFDCKREHTNSNGSLDTGIYQINSVHLKRINKKDMLDCFKNIDFAHRLYKEQGGFQAWSAFLNGSWKNHDENI